MRLTLVGGWNRWLAALAVMSFALIVVGRANAGNENLRFQCTSPTSCGTSIANTTILVTNGVLPTLELTNVAAGDTAWLVVLVPTGSSASFTVNGNTPLTKGDFNSTYTDSNGSGGLFDFLIGTKVDSDDGFNQFSNIDTLATGSSPSSYTVYYVDLGTAGSSETLAADITGTLPKGSIIWAFSSSSSGCSTNITDCTSISNDVPPSATLTDGGITPEPATLGLVGSGLLLLGIAIRRRQHA